MEALFRRYLWAVDLAVVALCAIFLARATASAVESRLVVPPSRPAAWRPSTLPATVYTKDLEPILTRNIFCSGCPPIIKAPEQPVAEQQLPPQRTSLPLALLAIMYSPPPHGIQWSVAVLRDTEDRSSGAFGVGGKVRGATITAIEETRVYLDNGGRDEYVDLLEPSSPSSSSVAAAPPPPAPTPAGAPAGNDALAQELERIKSTGEHTYDIPRSTLESVLGNMNALSRSARIVPEIRDGKAAGFRLYSVRPEGPFAKIGMQNGDVISSINGLEITSPEKALEVYAKLKSASHLSVGLERNGQKVTKDYSIR